MGNTLSETEIQQRYTIIDKIIKLKFNTLDLNIRNGVTGYLDFINPTELGSNNVMCGLDQFSRPFIVFKAQIEYTDGSKLQTFTTFFQRYDDNKLTWHTCGHYGTLLCWTDGGATNEQFAMIHELLSNGIYQINGEKFDKLRLHQDYNNFNFSSFKNSDESSQEYGQDCAQECIQETNIELNKKIPILIRIGYS
jgi:hypothetical protein